MPLSMANSLNQTAGTLFNRVLSSAERLFTSMGRTSLLISNGLRLSRSEYRYWSEYPLSLRHRLRAWRHGFTSRDYTLLNLRENNPHDYLSSREQGALIQPAIEESYLAVFRNKIAFYLATQPYLDALPEVYGTIERGLFEPLYRQDAYATVAEVIENEGDVIIKPITGTMGRDVHHVRADGTGYAINDKFHTSDEFQRTLESLDGHLVSEYISQHEYSATICPDSTNTMRILTMFDPDEQEMILVSAIHRFGNDSTGPVDNWSGGGFAAPIDVTTGELGELRTYTASDGLVRLDRHPDSGADVAGVRIPEWSRIESTVLDAAALHKEVRYVGWDVVLSDEDQPMILEGNTAPHVGLQQLGSGLFEDDRAIRFFEEYVRT